MTAKAAGGIPGDATGRPGWLSGFGVLKAYPFLVGVGLVAFLSTAGLAIIIPTLPLYLKNDLGFSAGVIGLLLSVYATAEILAKTPFGIFSDRYGRRRVILLGLLLAALVPLGFILARHPLAFVLLQVVNGLGVAAFWPVLSALIADSVREEDGTPALAVVNMAYLAALGVGPALGTYLNHFLKISTGAFYAAALLLLLSLLLGGVVLPQGSRRPSAPTPAGERPRPEGLTRAGLAGPLPGMLLISLLQQFGIGLLGGTFILFVNRQLGFSQGEIGTALLIPAAVVAVFAIPLGQGAERLGKPRAVQFAYFISAATLAVVPLLHQIWQLTIAVAVLALAYVAGAPAWLALVSQVAPAGRKGTALAGISTMQSLGFIAGSPVGGVLYEKLSPVAPLWGGGGILAVCLVLALLLLPRGADSTRPA